MRYVRGIRGAAFVAAALVMPALAGLSAAEAVEWRLTHVVRGTHPFNTTAQFIKERVEAETKGEFKINIFDGGKLGDEVATMDLYKTGDVDIGFHYSASASTVVKPAGILNFPFLFKDEAEWKAFMATPAQHDYWAKKVAGASPALRLGRLGTFGTKDLYTKSKTFKTIEDFKGLKFRVTPSPVLVEAWRFIGAEPLAMAYAEVYSAIQTGVIDGADNAPSGYDNGKHYEVAKNYTRTQHEVSSVFLLVREAAYAQLSAPHRAALDKALADSQDFWLKSSKDFAAGVEGNFGKWGVNDLKVEPALIKSIQDKVAPLRDKIAADNGLADFVKAIDDFRAKRGG